MNYLDKLLGEGEKPVFTTHQHWVAFLTHNWTLMVLILVLLAAAVAFNLYGFASPPLSTLPAEQQLLVRLALCVALLVYPASRFLLNFFRWRAEQYVVTNLRVIQLAGIFEKNVLDSSLEKVNDVMMHQSLLGRWLNYGDLEILTASELAANRFDRVAWPLQFKTAMLNAKQELEHGSGLGSDSIRDAIAKYAALRDQGIISEEEFQQEKRQLLARR